MTFVNFVKNEDVQQWHSVWRGGKDGRIEGWIALEMGKNEDVQKWHSVWRRGKGRKIAGWIALEGSTSQVLDSVPPGAF